MIQTEQTVTVDRDIDSTWNYAKEFQRWASIMPGYQTCELEDEDNSRWVLKIGVGAMIRTVKVRVHVDEWAGPERVGFSFKLEGDPVVGKGSYLAAPAGDGKTEITLRVQVEGSGPMAPMWEAMGAPVLPKFTRGFARELKARIETQPSTGAPASAVVSNDQRKSDFAGWAALLRSVWSGLFTRKQS